MNEYVCCKLSIYHQSGTLQVTQPVQLHSKKYEFDIPEETSPCTTAEAGQVLVKVKTEDNMAPEKQT